MDYFAHFDDFGAKVLDFVKCSFTPHISKRCDVIVIVSVWRHVSFF